MALIGRQCRGKRYGAGAAGSERAEADGRVGRRYRLFARALHRLREIDSYADDFAGYPGAVS
jgi:hypothetical protein